MKIGCIGAACTGKTTFAKALQVKLQQEGYEIPFLPSVVRDVYAKFQLTEKDMDTLSKEQKQILQWSIFQARRETEQQYSSFISDRTLLDHVMYYLLHCDPTGEEWEKLDKEVWHNLNTYDYLIYFPMSYGWFPEEDQFRRVSFAYNRVLDFLLRDWLNHNAVKYDTIGVGSVEERVGAIVEWYKFRDILEEKCIKHLH